MPTASMTQYILRFLLINHCCCRWILHRKYHHHHYWQMPNPMGPNCPSDSGNRYFYHRIFHPQYHYHTIAKSNSTMTANSTCRPTSKKPTPPIPSTTPLSNPIRRRHYLLRVQLHRENYPPPCHTNNNSLKTPTQMVPSNNVHPSCNQCRTYTTQTPPKWTAEIPIHATLMQKNYAPPHHQLGGSAMVGQDREWIQRSRWWHPKFDAADNGIRRARKIDPISLTGTPTEAPEI